MPWDEGVASERNEATGYNLDGKEGSKSGTEEQYRHRETIICNVLKRPREVSFSDIQFIIISCGELIIADITLHCLVLGKLVRLYI